MEIFKLFGRVLVETSGAEQNLDSTDGKAKSLTSRLGGYIKTAASWAAAVGGIIASLSGAMKLAAETAAKGDAIDKNSQKIGVSAKAYQEWDAVLQHCGTSMDKMSSGFKTLTKAAQNGSKEQQAAFKAIGISAEEAANMTTEELWSRTVSGLQGLEDSSERAYYAQKLLGGSAQELGALFNTSAEDTQAMIDRVNELGGVMGDDAVAASAHFQDNLQDLQTVVDGLKTRLGEKLLPVLNSLMDWLLAHSDDITGFFENVAAFFERAKTRLEPYMESIRAGVGQLREAYDNLKAKLEELGITWGVSWEGMETVASLAFGALQGIIGGITSLINGIVWAIDGIASAARTAYNWIQNLISAKNSTSWSLGGSGGRYGSFANGMEYIPFDGYTATLHKGERVLTAEENANYSRRGGKTERPIINQYVQSVAQSPLQLAMATEAAFETAKWS